MEYQSVYTLAEEMKRSEAYSEYARLRDVVMADETNATLLKEYRRMQGQLQMTSMAHKEPDKADVDRFSSLTSLLFANSDVQAYLLAEMRLQQALAQVLKILGDALELPMEVPGL